MNKSDLIAVLAAKEDLTDLQEQHLSDAQKIFFMRHKVW